MDKMDTIKVSIDKMDATSIGVKSLSVGTDNGDTARNAIDTIKTALTKVSRAGLYMALTTFYQI